MFVLQTDNFTWKILGKLNQGNNYTWANVLWKYHFACWASIEEYIPISGTLEKERNIR